MSVKDNFKDVFFTSKSFIARTKVRSIMDRLIDIENTSEIILRSINENRRTEMVLNAYDNVDFYREKYKSTGFTRQDLKHANNFMYLPLISRNDVRINFDSMFSKRFDKSLNEFTSTGGSTGLPIKIGTDPRYALEVISWRRLRYWGASPGHNSGYIYRVIPKGIGAITRKLFFFPTTRCYLSATEMTESNINYFLKKILQNNSSYLVAYVGSLKILAEYIKANNIKLPNLKFIWSTSAPLPLPLKIYLEKIFQVPVYSQYGSAEFYWIASERKDRRGLDIDWDIRNVEILNENGNTINNGEYGEIVVSDLINHAFPLIRYQIGDRGRFISDNKNNFPFLDFVNGRVSHVLHMLDGRKIPGEFWTTIFDDYPEAVLGFSIHQRKDKKIIINYNPSIHWNECIENNIMKLLQRVCLDTPFDLAINNAIDNDRGKLNYITTEL